MLTGNMYTRIYKLKPLGKQSGASKFVLKRAYFYVLPYTRITVSKVGADRMMKAESPDKRFRVFIVYVWGMESCNTYKRLTGIEVTLDREYEWFKSANSVAYNTKVQYLIDQGYICVDCMYNQIADPFLLNRIRFDQSDRIAHTFKQRRLALALTQVQISEISELKPSTISRFEKGYQSIRIDGLFKVAEILQLDLYAVNTKTCSVMPIPTANEARWIVKKSRLDANMTISALAIICHVHPSTIINIERCISNTTLDMLIRLYSIFDLSIITKPHE